MEEIKNLLRDEEILRPQIDASLASNAFDASAAVFMARYVRGAENILRQDCGDGVSLAVKEDVSPEEFEAYVKAHLEASPAAFVSEIAGNRFLSMPLTQGYRYTMYIPARRQVRFLYADKGELMPLQLGDKPSYAGKKTVTQIAPNDEAKNFGMCYIFALGEGHFLIYDGLGDRGGDEDKIYASLLSSTPEGQKPIIDAWILTHPHFDHIAGVWKFALKYHDAVEVRNFVMNMLPPYRYPMQLWKEAAACHARWLPEIFSSFPEAKIQKAHTGQTFSVGDARVEVLYTQEEFSGFEAPMNDTSLVTRVFLGGKSLIFPADISGDAECRWIHDLYGSYLKSDFYQLAHHAWDTEVLHFYYDIDPTDMLWPLRARDWDRERMWTFPATQVYKAEYDAGSRRFHIARGEDIVIPLGE